jgi:hypothetical protein
MDARKHRGRLNPSLELTGCVLLRSLAFFCTVTDGWEELDCCGDRCPLFGKGYQTSILLSELLLPENTQSPMHHLKSVTPAKPFPSQTLPPVYHPSSEKGTSKQPCSPRFIANSIESRSNPQDSRKSHASCEADGV